MLHGLKQGNEVLKEIHKEMNLETVEKLGGNTRSTGVPTSECNITLLEGEIHTRLNRRSAKCWPIT